MKVVAIDFETATTRSDSACALALATIEDGELLGVESFFIRPPSRAFEFTWLHGISWEDVQNSPSFDALVPEFNRILKGADYIAAHNAGFDRKVLYTCYAAAGHEPPETPFVCTVKIARRVWKRTPNSLDVVCVRLGIPLDHHNHASDAEACARIVLASAKEAFPIEGGMMGKPSYSVTVRR